MAFNSYQIKKRAHALSRHNSGWSPFNHMWDLPRRQTVDIEAQSEPRANPDWSPPIQHANTAPAVPSNRYSDDETARPSLGKEPELQPASPGRQASSATVVDSPPSSAPQDGLRNRKENAKNPADCPPPAADHSPGDVEKKDAEKPNGIFKHVRPKTPFTVGNQIQRTILSSWINILMVAAPVGIALNYVKSVDRVAVFVVNFIAIIPLAAMLSFATEEIALRTGETLGGLLNATFGNAVELIVAIMALTQNQVVIVQTSLIGSILSNLLLVMGMCFFFGGLRRQEQFFNTTVAQTAASLLALAVASIIVPTVFDHSTASSLDVDVPALSRGTAVITLFVYGAYLFFQLKTHSKVFSAESQKVPAKPFHWEAVGQGSLRPFRRGIGEGAVAQGMVNPAALMGAHGLNSDPQQLRQMLLDNNPHAAKNEDKEDDDDDVEEEPKLHFMVAVATLTISTVFIALCAEYMVDSIDAVTQSGGLSEEFVGLILLPIVGNAAEHATAVTVAIKDKMDLAIGVAVGSSMQVALFLIPLLVVIGWGMGVEQMTLSFDIFQVAVLFVAVLLVNYLIADGKSHWLEGMLLICLYFIIAVCSWWYPSDKGGSSSS